MRILHVYKDYFPVLGGIENHVKTLAELQVQAGHEVTVLATNPGGLPSREQLNGVHVIRAWRLATVASTPLSPLFPGQLRRLHPDIAHLHFPYPVGEVSQWLAARRRPYVITYHSDVVRQQSILRFYGPLMRRILTGAARVLPTSQRYMESSPFLQDVADRCTVVPLSVDLEVFAEAKPLFPPATVPTLLFVGRHRYYKGVDTLIRAMTELPARLLIGGSGPMRRSWMELADSLALGDRVRFVGEVSDADLPRLYASADVFVLPANARSEAFGKVLLEAMAAGLACVTTEVGTGTSYVVQDGVTGFVVGPAAAQELASAIRRLLEDEGLRKHMGAAGRERVETEFTQEKMVNRVLAVYTEVLERRAGESTF